MAERIVACICEGGAESEIIRILLENDRLIFRGWISLMGKHEDAEVERNFRNSILEWSILSQ